MNKLHFILLTLGLLLTSVFSWKALETETPENIKITKGISTSSINPQHELIFITAPCDSLHFCNEQIPLSKRIEKTISKQEKKFFYLKRRNHKIIKQAKEWFPLIEPILASYGIPEDFKYFTIVESNLSNVKSSQNAVGYWQLIPATARELGLIVNDEVDERYDPVKSTHAACKYLKQSYKRLKNWSNVAASYNMGITGLHRQLRRQKKKFYYDLILNRETALYVYKGIAVKKLLEKRGKYSYRLADKIDKPDFISLAVNENIESLESFASQYQIDYKTLQKHNPWIRATKLTVDSTHQYTLKVPLVKAKEIELASN